MNPDLPYLTGPNGERITVEPVDPRRAQELLDLNTDNYRRLRPGLVDKYARDMVEKRWLFTGDKLGVETNGVLSDGQNRLSAQIKAGVTLWWTIVWDLTPESTMVMDTGGARTAADHLHHIGITNAREVAALAREIIRSSGSRRNTGVSTAEVDTLVREDKSIREICSKVSGLNSTLKLSTKRIIGYGWWKLHRIDPIKAEEFFRRLDRLDNLDKSSPILALHRRLLTIKNDKGTAGKGGQEQAATIIYAWNAWVAGEPREHLRAITRADGSIYMPEPRAPHNEPDAPAIVEQAQLPAHRRRNAG
jgi:hypothetical protein